MGGRRRRRRNDISRYSLNEYVRKRVDAIENNPFAFSYATPSASYRGKFVEKVEDSYASLASYAYRGDSVVAACMRVRRDLFRQAKFCWREIDEAGPGKIFRTDELELLDKPWPNGTTGELLARMITDVDLCGNSFIRHGGDRLRWLRPDWVSIVLSGDPQIDIDIDVLGYVYTPGGLDPEKNSHAYSPDEICHWAPEQDPLAFYRGMSWVSKALEEVQGDRAATTHKVAFFRNGATLGPIVRVPAGTSMQQFKEFMAAAEEAHAGAHNAYRTMYLGGGAEVTLAAADFRQLDLKSVQGGMETRIAAVAGVHPVLVGLSEGLAGSSLNSGNFAAARRATAEMTLYSLWQDACGALEAFFKVPDQAELWIRERDIPFLREEARDRAEIFKTQVLAIEAAMRAGFKPDPAVQATLEERLDLLIGAHTGLFSVQMQPPQSGMEGAPPLDVNGDGQPDEPGTPIDFGALRSDLWAFDDEDIERAVEEAFGDFDDEVVRDRYDVRVPKGFEGGGRFRKLSDRLVALLGDWAKGEGDDDPLDEYSRDQLRRVAKELADKARADGDNERAARLTPRRGASSDEIKLALYKDVRAHVRVRRDDKLDNPRLAKFTLQQPGKLHDKDVAVYRLPGDKPALFHETDSGKRGGLVERFDDLNGMAAWADEHGETRLAEWARKEAGGKAPLASPTPTKRIPPPPGFADDLAEEFYRNPQYAKQEIVDRLDGLTVAELKRVATAANVEKPREFHKTEAGPVVTTPKKLTADEWREHIAATIIKDRRHLGSPAPAKAPDVTPGRKTHEELDAEHRVREERIAALEKGAPAKKADLPDASDPEALRDALDLRKVDELKAMLRERGLPVSGRKRELVDRLVDAPAAKAPAAARPKAASVVDGLDDLTDSQLASLGREFEVPSAKNLYGAVQLTPTQRSRLMSALRRKGAKSPYARSEPQAAPTPARIPEDVPLVGDPDGDNSIMHGDSASMSLAQAYAAKGRNGTANEIMALRLYISTHRGDGAGDLDGPQRMVDELKQLRAVETDDGLKSKLDRVIRQLDIPRKDIPPLPDGTPPALRQLVEDLNRIPVARAPAGHRLEGATVKDASAVERLVQLLRRVAASKGQVSVGQTESEISDILRTFHESIDGAYRMWDLDRGNDGRVALQNWVRLLRDGGGAGPKGEAPAKPGRTPATPVPVRDLFDADDATIEAALKDVFEGKFGPYTTKARVLITRAGTRVDKQGRHHEVKPSSIGVEGKIYDAEGHEIGHFGRGISPVDLHYQDGTVRREMWANHSIVELGEGDYDENPTKYHGKGFGGEFNRRAIQWYRDSGVHGISQSDHNGYVWASQGFNFSGGRVPDYLVGNMRQLIADLRAGKRTSDATKDEYHTIPKRFRDAPDLDAQITAAEALLARLARTQPGDPDYPTAYEISQLGRRAGQRGKTALWLGKLLWVSADEMILNPDEGEVIGQ